MKKLVILFLAFIMLAACNNPAKEAKVKTGVETENSPGLTLNTSPGKTGTFSTEDISCTGKTSTQYFGDKAKDGFSIVCQQDEPYAMLQATFANEAQAKGSLKPAEGFYSMEPGEAHISLSGAKLGSQEFVTKEESTGSILVEGNKLMLKNLKLFNMDGSSKTVNAEVMF